ncbi:MAG: hypothetical protein MI746_07445 [Pseudomonadales bacterium]|nr:hypothetical protein [Pseudomonadales bacterium]
MAMIERLQRIATVLSPARSILAALAILSIAVVILSVIENPWLQSDQWLIPGVAAALWCLVLYSLSYLFLDIPPQPDSAMNWRRRLSVRLRRFGLWILGAVFIGLSFALLALTYQLLRVFFM